MSRILRPDESLSCMENHVDKGRELDDERWHLNRLQEINSKGLRILFRFIKMKDCNYVTLSPFIYNCKLPVYSFGKINICIFAQ